MNAQTARNAGERARTLLIVEDDAVIRDALLDGFCDEGFYVQTAGDGAEALEILGGDLPDLVLLDLMMPGMNGWEFLEVVRSRPRLSALPIFVLTAAANAGKLPAGYPVFFKPLKLNDLNSTVRAYLA
jgi:CheY-like chemotaxis protein